MFIIVSVISDDIPFLLWLQGMPSMGETAFVVWAGDGGIDGVVLLYPQRVTSAIIRC